MKIHIDYRIAVMTYKGQRYMALVEIDEEDRWNDSEEAAKKFAVKVLEEYLREANPSASYAEEAEFVKKEMAKLNLNKFSDDCAVTLHELFEPVML